MRMVGRWTRKARSLTREFRSGFDEMVREAELEEVRKTVETAKSGNISKQVKDAIDPTGFVDKSLERRGQGGQGRPARRDGKQNRGREYSASGSETLTDDAPKANVISHPTKIAPPHSITPPKPAAPAPAESAAGVGGDSEAGAGDDPAKSAREA